MLPRVFLAAALLTTGAIAAPPPVPPTTKQVPPKGVAIPDADRQELTQGAAALRAEIDALAQSAPEPLRALLPDVEIFWKAVDWPLRYDEFMDAKHVGTAKTLLKEGFARAKAMREGNAPWASASGPIVRGYRSKIDGSVQPYGLLIPTTWKPGDQRPRPLHVWNHGRGDTLMELPFIAGAMKKVGEFTPEDTFVLAPYGRFCNATKFAGETDVFEALEHVAKQYPIDPRRRVLAGFSMGGASSWHLGSHTASMWAAVAPGAGFAETAVYTKAFAPGKEPPPWWEQVLWRLYDATEYAANFSNTHLIAYSGEDDPQKQAAEIMEAAAKREGLAFEHLIGPGVGHKYEPETKKHLASRLDEAVRKGAAEHPAKVRLVTYTLKYPRQHWVTVTGLEKHWERAEVNAEILDEGTIRIATKNVTGLRLHFEGAVPLDATRPARVLLDAQELAGPKKGKAVYVRRNGKWEPYPEVSTYAPPLRKHHGLQGPIDDAFMDSFVFVRPTGKPLNPTVGAWVEAEMARAIKQWRTVFRGDVRVVDDTAVSAALMAEANVVLWGDPSSNKVIARMLPSFGEPPIACLPITWTAEKVTLGTTTYPAADHAPVLIYPNPITRERNRYVVLNSSFTFRQGSNTTNALQTPNLPDWAVVDLRTPPSAKWPGLVVDAGFFDEDWQFPK